MKLDLSSWARALDSLQRGIARAQAAPADEELRDAVIQRFEYCYELSWKMLKRHLEQVIPDPASADQWSFKEMMREAAERGLIAEVEPWLEYRHQRNQTAHIYDEEKARLVYGSAVAFLKDARTLLRAVEERNVD
jgi:nucleotidyltransferase substrate binding protein (TIGR01987 family)